MLIKSNQSMNNLVQFQYPEYGNTTIMFNLKKYKINMIRKYSQKVNHTKN